MVGKLELNNELITLRTQFLKAKIRTINKLTRKLKTLEHGKKKDPKNTKLDGKTKKMEEELKLIKEATKLGMVKKVFVFNQDPDKVLKLQKATAEQRAVCRLLMNNPFLKEAVAASKKKLDIKDDDEEWKKLIFELGKNKKRKLKKEKLEAAAGIEPTSALEKKIAAKKAKNKEKKAKKKTSALDPKSKTIDKKPLKEKSDQKKQQLLKPKKSKPSSTDNSPPKKVNLFPIEADKGEKKPPRKEFGGAKKEFNGPRKDFSGPKKDFAPKKGNDSFKPKGDSKAEKLHPSWEAKKQKKPTISEFKGKKITFDE